MTVWDAPNQQVVRADASAPWDEGDGGGAPPGEGESGGQSLDYMTKADLIDEAAARGVDVDPTATKAEIREALGE